jgi:integrase
MAFVFQRPKSGFWYISYRDPSTGKRCKIATRHRVGTTAAHRSALAEAAELTAKELRRTGEGNDGSATAWNRWVPRFIEQVYAHDPKTRLRYDGCWRNVALFLEARGVHSPAQLRREHCYEYLGWRERPPKDSGTFKVSRNTALLELKFLGRVMREAVERGLAQGNPCWRLGVERIAPAEKPELTDEQIASIRAELPAWPDWMMHAFEIAIHQGLRLRETRIPMNCVDLDRGTLTILTPKGGHKKAFTTAIHPGLRPLLERLKAKGHQFTAEVPTSAFASKAFVKLFRKVGLVGVSFHSTRVSVITRLARSNVNEALARKFVNHSTSTSSTVHRIYQRLRAEDLSPVTAALHIPPRLGSSDSPGEKPGSTPV